MAMLIAFILGTCIIGTGVVFHIVGMATTHWMTIDYGSLEVDVGLFRSCVDIIDQCDDLENLKSPDLAVHALAILGVLTGGAGLIAAVTVVILTFAGKNIMELMRLAPGLLCAIGSVFIFLCVIIYGAKVYKDMKDDIEDVIDGASVSLEYSFGLTIVGGLLLLIGAGVVLASGKITSHSKRTGTAIDVHTIS